MAPGILLGAILGTFIIRFLSTDSLRWIFGGFAFLIGLYFLSPKFSFRSRSKPQSLSLNIFGTCIACFSNLLGIGGGTFLVPLFTYFRFETKETIGTAAALSFFITSLGVLEYMTFSMEYIALPYCLGSIYLPAFFLTGIAGLIGAFYGTKLAHTLPTNTLKRCFAFAMLVIGFSMILT